MDIRYNDNDTTILLYIMSINVWSINDYVGIIYKLR